MHIRCNKFNVSKFSAEKFFSAWETFAASQIEGIREWRVMVQNSTLFEIREKFAT